MAAGLIFSFVLVFGDLPSPYLPGGGMRAGVIYILVLPLLGLTGAAATIVDLPAGSRAGWALVSGVSGFVEVVGCFYAATAIYGP